MWLCALLDMEILFHYHTVFDNVIWLPPTILKLDYHERVHIHLDPKAVCLISLHEATMENV